MSAEYPAEIETESPPPPPPAADADAVADADKQPKKGVRARLAEVREKPSPELEALERSANLTLREIVERLGAQGAFKCRVTRVEPTDVEDKDGYRVQLGGFLKDYFDSIDEADLAKAHGGGRFKLQFFTQRNGSWKLGPQRTVDIAGDPRTDDVPRTRRRPDGGGQPGPPAPLSESPTVVTKAMDAMMTLTRDAQEQARRESGPRGIDPATQAVTSILQQQLDASNRAVETMRKELSDIRNAPVAPADTFKDTLLTKFMEGDSARLESVRLRFESEIRMLRDQAISDEKRIRDMGERDKLALQQTHDRELAMARMSYETAAAATKMSLETQLEIVRAEVRKLERENTEIKSELKDLRAKKDKTIIETAKEMEAVKEALGIDSDTEKTNFDKVMDLVTNPEAVNFAQQVFSRKQEPAAKEAAKEEAPTGKRKIVRTPDGQLWAMMDDGSLKGPLKQKKKIKGDQAAAQPAAPGEEPLPEVDPEQAAMVIGYLERSFANKVSEETVVQSYRAMVPEPIMRAIKELGIDGFMSKVAKLPSSSPLSARQDGRTWVRRVGTLLVGE